MYLSSCFSYLGYLVVLTHLSSASHPSADSQISSMSYQPAYVVPGHVVPVLLTNKTISRRTARLSQRQVDCRLFGEICDSTHCCPGTGACCGSECCDAVQGSLCIDGRCCPFSGCETSGNQPCGGQVSLLPCRDFPSVCCPPNSLCDLNSGTAPRCIPAFSSLSPSPTPSPEPFSTTSSPELLSTTVSPELSSTTLLPELLSTTLSPELSSTPSSLTPSSSSSSLDFSEEFTSSTAPVSSGITVTALVATTPTTAISTYSIISIAPVIAASTVANPTSPASSPFTPGVIGGIAGAGAVVLIVLILAILWCCRNRKKHGHSQTIVPRPIVKTKRQVDIDLEQARLLRKKYLIVKRMHDEYKAWLVKQRTQQASNAAARRQARNQKLVKVGIKFVAKKLFLHGLANVLFPGGGSLIVEGISYFDPSDAWDAADAIDAAAVAGDVDIPDWDALDLDTVDLAFSFDDPPDLTGMNVDSADNLDQGLNEFYAMLQNANLPNLSFDTGDASLFDYC